MTKGQMEDKFAAVADKKKRQSSMNASECVGVAWVQWLPTCKYTQGQLNYCSELLSSSTTPP